MSEHDDTLLDEDLGDEEYDLGNDEEEALLADDYEVERQNSYKGEEETDDVLDLGVTDALDDLEGDDENVEFNRRKTDQCNENSFYKEEEHIGVEGTYYEQDETAEYHTEQIHRYEGDSTSDNINIVNTNIAKGDLREKLQKNVQKLYIGDGQGMEDDEGEEAKERRNRFQTERTIISPKMNNEIPDSLENVVTSEPGRPPFRGRGRGRGSRGSRGGRYITQSSGNFNPRFSAPRGPVFENQQPICRPPLLETRPPFLLGVSSGIQNQQMIYQQSNPQVQPFQQFSPNGPPPQGPPHFIDNRPPFNPNQFQGPTGPRPIGPRMAYEPRSSMAGPMQGSSFNCPPNQPPYVQMQPPYQNAGTILQDNQGRPMQSNQGPLLHGNPGGPSLLGNPAPLMSGNPAPLLQGNQPLPLQGFPRQPAPPAQLPLLQNHPNAPIPSQPPFESRPSYQESHFDSRPGYVDQPPRNQFNMLPASQQQQPSLPPSSIPNVPLPPGHKILINPHFRGTVQPANDARLVWDSVQSQAPSQNSNGQFNHPSAPYQTQNSYNQSQQAPYQQNYLQNKNDDPYAYFSDVWQENRPQKPLNVSPNKQYPIESNYPRESNYNDSKYKDGQWEPRDHYQEEHRGFHQNYRERDLPPKSRTSSIQKFRPSSSTYRGDSYDQSQKSPSNKSINTTNRGMNRTVQKRISDTSDRAQRDISPKRTKTDSRHLQEVHTVDIPSDTINENKDEVDPEMQEYLKKIEEQKKLREKILREKENRRRKAAMEKQNKEFKNESSVSNTENTQQETKPVSILMSVKDTVTNKARITTTGGRGRGRPVNAQTTEANERASGVRIVRTMQPNDSFDTNNSKASNIGQAVSQVNDSAHVKPLNPQSGTRRVVIQKPLMGSQKIPTTVQKTVSNAQKVPVSLQNKVAPNQPTTLKRVVVAQKPVGNTQRIVCQKTTSTLQKTVINVQEANAQKVVLNTQSNQRVVLQKTPTQVKKVPEIKTNTVKVENLAASTSEAQIRRMCQGIGTIESIHMGDGSATIVFKTQSAAMVFHKKYQRKMLDLSLITVHLVPQTSVNKATAVVKKS